MSTEHGHDHVHPRPDSKVALRARALEALLAEKGLVATDAIDAVVELYQYSVGPQNGARVVAARLGRPGLPRAAAGRRCQGHRRNRLRRRGGLTLVAVANTPTVRNVIVRALCSCYPVAGAWPAAHLVQEPAYRARVVAEPGMHGAAQVRPGAARRGRDRVWDSSAEVRYLVVPMRPAGTDGLTEEALSALVTRDCMIGTAVPQAGSP